MSRSVLLRSSLGGACVLAFACSSPSPSAPRFVLTAGHEANPWQIDPKPESAVVTRIAEDGTRTEFLTSPAPLDAFDIESSGIARYELEGDDAAGQSVVLARSLLLNQGAFVDMTVPLFEGRRGAFARPPGDLDAPGDAPAATLVAGRSLLLAAAADSTGIVNTERYDFGAWAPVLRRVPASCGSAGCGFDTLASVGSSLVLAVGNDAAMWFDLSDGSSGAAPLPAGLTSYTEIAGGRTIAGPDGTAYVVGATRAGTETSAVLVIAPDGTLSVMRLTAPRAGAAVAWLDGLVVVGGNARASGAERWVVGSNGFEALVYPPDSTVGAALVPLDTHTVVRLGGTTDGIDAPGVTLAIDCASACTPAPYAPALGLTAATAVAAGTDVVVAGTDSTGATSAVRVAATSVTPLAMREPRINATVLDVWSLGELAIVGGHHADGSAASSVELFVW